MKRRWTLHQFIDPMKLPWYGLGLEKQELKYYKRKKRRKKKRGKK